MRVTKMPRKAKAGPKAKITGKVKDRGTAKVKAKPVQRIPGLVPPIRISEEEQAKQQELMDERRLALRDALTRRTPQR